MSAAPSPILIPREMNPETPIALTIAGSDPSGGAGLQIDLRCFERLDVYGMAVVSLLTVQNTVGVERVEVMSADLVLEQLNAVLTDIPPLAVKTGALGSVENIATVGRRLKDSLAHLVVDPVLVSKHGDRLADDTAVDAYRRELLPLATIVTPNRFEAERFLSRSIETNDPESSIQAAQALAALGPKYVLLKAGLINDRRVHVLANTTQATLIETRDYETRNNHGAGCALAASITGRLAKLEMSQNIDDAIQEIVDSAITSTNRAIDSAPGLGHGYGPIDSKRLGPIV